MQSSNSLDYAEDECEHNELNDDVFIKVCDDSKIKKKVIEISRHMNRSQSPLFTGSPHSNHDLLMGTDIEYRSNGERPLIIQERGRETLEEHYNLNGQNAFTPGFGARKLDSLSLPPHTHMKHIKTTNMEKQLNEVRKRFDKQMRMESQLGLTPVAGSIPDTPHVAVDMEDRVLERREELGFRRMNFWKSCCGQVIDRRATQFFVQVIIGAGVMIFCMAKIWQAVPLTGCTGEDTTVYFSLLSALVGFYIPSPSMHKQ